MRTSLFLIIFLFSSLLSIDVFAQNQQNIEHKVASEAFDKERTIKVFLPERYFRDSTSHFIVVYVLDAQDDQVWNMVTGNIDYAVSRYTVIPMIAVGIASDDRSAEFSPNSTKLHQHFREEVFPLIESKYRIKPHRTILGHSWGGAFVGNTLFSDNADMFDAFLGLSPSFDALDNVIFNQADSLLQLKKDFGKYFYYSSGTVGFEKEYEDVITKMDSLLDAGNAINLMKKSQIFEDMDHFSALSPAVNMSLVLMSRNYFIDQKTMESFALNPNQTVTEQFNSFYSEKEKVHGFVHRPSVPYLRYVADGFRDSQQFETALEIYNIGLKESKNDVRTNFAVADTYDKMGKYEMAKPFFNTALEFLEKQRDKFTESYYNAMSGWANKKLEGYKK